MKKYKLIAVHDSANAEELYEARSLEDIVEFAELKGGIRADGGDPDGS